MPATASSSASKRTLVDSEDYADSGSDGDYQEKRPKKRAAPSKGKAKAAFSTPAKPLPEHTQFSLALQIPDQLIKIVLDLQATLKAEREANVKKAADAKPSAEQVASKVDTQRKAMVRGISKGMVWRRELHSLTSALNSAIADSSLSPASAKHGGAKFSFDVVVTSVEVFLGIFNLPATFKKAGKLTIDEFRAACGGHLPSGSVRYDTLGVTGDRVNIRYKPDEAVATVSGSYGKGGAW